MGTFGFARSSDGYLTLLRQSRRSHVDSDAVPSQHPAPARRRNRLNTTAGPASGTRRRISASWTLAMNAPTIATCSAARAASRRRGAPCRSAFSRRRATRSIAARRRPGRAGRTSCSTPATCGTQTDTPGRGRGPPAPPPHCRLRRRAGTPTSRSTARASVRTRLAPRGGARPPVACGHGSRDCCERLVATTESPASTGSVARSESSTGACVGGTGEKTVSGEFSVCSG